MESTHKYIRDPNNPGAIINTDKEGLQLYKQRKAQSQKLIDMEESIDVLKTDIHEIKELLILLAKE